MPITTFILVRVTIAGLVILFSMVGLGGGATYVPVLVAAGIAFHEAATTSLFMIICGSLSATLVFGRKGVVD